MTNAFPPDDPDESWELSNQQLQEQLAHLLQGVCQSPAGSARRRKGQNQIIRLIQQSGHLRRYQSPHYEDCLQQLWLYLFDNLCAVNTQRYPKVKIPFCEEPRIVGRLNLRLRGLINDAWEREQERLRNQEPRRIVDGEERDPLDYIPAPELKPLRAAALPPVLQDAVRAALMADETGELSRCHLENYAEVNCQRLILQQLSPDISWEAIAGGLGLPISLLSFFYEQHCRPLLEKICEQQLLWLIRAKIEADESGELRQCYVKGHPEVNCQVLILRRLPPEMKWQDLANEFGLRVSTLSSFYQRQCNPRVKIICEELQLLISGELEES